MWLRDPLAVEISRNTAVPIGFQFWDEATDAPLDITGYRMVCRIAATEGATKIVEFGVDVFNAETGEVDVVFNGPAINYPVGFREEVTLAGQIIATDTSGESVTAARLIIYLVPGIN